MIGSLRVPILSDCNGLFSKTSMPSIRPRSSVLQSRKDCELMDTAPSPRYAVSTALTESLETGGLLKVRWDLTDLSTWTLKDGRGGIVVVISPPDG